MNGKEIIDLTSSEDHEVIILDSGDENEGPSTKRTRRKAAGGPDGGSEVQADAEGAAGNDTEDMLRRKKRRSQRAKRRKQTIVGSEEGEVIEIDGTEDSEQVSRAQSEERNATGESSRPISGKVAGDRTARNLLDRLADAEDARAPNSETEHRPSNSERKKKKKRKRRRDDHEMETKGHDPLDSLFFVDDGPAEVPAAAKFKDPAIPSVSSADKANEQAVDDKPLLLLPGHVSVFEGTGDAPLEIIVPPEPDSEDEDYIEYLDYDDDRRAGVARYFDDPAEAKPTRIICKRCGAEDGHKAKDCFLMICLTCGARDEHSTRSCPISKTCYTCGMKGHLNRDCPNRYTARGHGKYEDCDRCGSTFHQTIECPTLWRMYDYVDDSERLRILHEREEVRDLDLGEGGEGYIGADDWCYNCGGCGHLGDDCTQPHPQEFPREPSAFSVYNINAGPFADAQVPELRKPSRAATYAAQAEKAWGDGYGYVMPLDVGKQAKKKEKARMERRAQVAQDDDGEVDWFATRRGPKSNGGGGTAKGPRHNSRASGSANTKITFGDMGARDDDRYGRDRTDRRDGGRRGDRDERDYDLPGPSRETDSIQIRGAARRAEKHGGDRGEWDGSIRGAASRGKSGYDGGGKDAGHEQRRKGRSRNDERRGDHARKDDRDRRGASPGRGPRYRGGYSR